MNYLRNGGFVIFSIKIVGQGRGTKKPSGLSEGKNVNREKVKN